MKSINAPDLHIIDKRIKPEWHEKGIASLTTLAETVERKRPDLVTIPGDLYHGGIQNSGASGFPAFLRLIRRILDVCPIAAVAGTGSHDPIGAYKVLAALAAKHPFIFLDPAEMSPPVAWIREDGKVEVEIWSKESPVGDGHTAKLMIMGIPEPTKEWLLADEKLLPENAGEALKTSLRAILLGFGAIRAQYPDVPCVFLYHGVFSGATMQNGQSVGPAEIVIGREDLQLIAPDITARYGGNGYPKEWGELGQAGFDMVELHPGDTYGSLGHIHMAQEVVHGREISVTRFDYPHPRREKFSVDALTVDGNTAVEPIGEAVTGVQAWICIRATKEQAREINAAEVLVAYRGQGALPGSRVTLELIPTETVRAAEITGKHALEDKLEVYSLASNDMSFKGNVVIKARLLEAEAAASGVAPEGLHIRIRKLRLRGAIGIWKGQHVDEIELDLDHFDAGLIALIDGNGAGKTTLIENMHPYSQMLTRDGALQQHFRLRDSLRELTFTDERTGDAYRALIQIDGANASGSCEYHLFKDGEPITDGRKKSYDEAILRLFGSLPLFLRSAFVSQRSTKTNPDLTEATKGEKKEIFRELAGLDYLQAYAENAKQKAGLIEAEIDRAGAQVSLIEGQLQALPSIREDRTQKADDVAVRQAELRTQELRGLSLKSDVEQLAEKVKAQELLQQKIDSLEDQAAQRRQAVDAAEELIAGYQAAVEQAPAAQKAVDAWTNLKEREGKENERLSAINKKRGELSTEYGNALKAHSTDVRGLEAARTRIRTEKARLEGDHKVLLSNAARIEKELAQPLTDVCDKCGSEKEHWHKDLNAGRAEKQQELEEVRKQIHDLGNEIMKKDFEVIQVKDPDAPTAPILPVADETQLKLIRAEISALDIERARGVLTQAQQAATRTEETRKQAEQATIEATRFEKEIAALGLGIDLRLALEYAEAQEKLETARRDYGEAQKLIAGLEADIRGLDARISDLETQANDLEQLKAKIAAAKADCAGWEYLVRACGPDGIQALELDAMGPGIAEVANRLLSSAYGSRFQLEFRTTRIAGKGSKTKQVEDFSIWILDSQDGTEQELSTLSGGESVWIKRALYDAFGIIRDRNTGTKFLTVFADEADGALDPEAKVKYVIMLQQAHQESGRRNTLVISHSPEVQEMIPQKIDLVKIAQESQKPGVVG